MRKLCIALATLAVTAVASPAQESTVTPEIRPFVGMYVPTGDQRDLFENSAMYGLQAALEVRPNFHLLGTFGWVPAKTKYAAASDQVSILQYDVGMELDMVRSLGESWLFKPFFGLGGGARTYRYDDDNLTNQTCAAGYVALGTEFQYGRTAIRFEGRDNIFCYKSALPNVESKTRNDVGLSLGLAYHFR
jgi:Outer membrane protein beta-barrel domain